MEITSTPVRGWMMLRPLASRTTWLMLKRPTTSPAPHRDTQEVDARPGDAREAAAALDDADLALSNNTQLEQPKGEQLDELIHRRPPLRARRGSGAAAC
jgi:hypothetical protein